MAKTHASNAKPVWMDRPLRVALLWTPHTLMGPACALIDVVRSLHVLAKVRQPQAAPPAVWRWICPGSQRAPRLQTVPDDPTYEAFKGGADLWFLPGWIAHSGPHMDELVAQASVLTSAYRRDLARGAQSVAVGNGVVFAAASGALSGKSAVAPWAFVPSLLRHCADVQLVSDRSWVGHENLWSCTAAPLATELLLRALSHSPLQELAQAVMPLMVHTPERQEVVHQVSHQALTRPVPAGCVERARRWLQDHLAEPYDLSRLAQTAATSPRSLLRHFQMAQGQTPLQFLQHQRMARARMLLETTYLPVDQVALACGFQDAGTFRRNFRQHTGQLPANYRTANRLRSSRKLWAG